MKDFVKRPRLYSLFTLYYYGNSEPAHVRITVYRTYRTRRKDYYMVIEKAYQGGMVSRLFDGKVDGDLKEEIMKAIEKHTSDMTLNFFFVDRKLLSRARKYGLNKKDGLEGTIEKLLNVLNKA